jgi:hypothetical protein
MTTSVVEGQIVPSYHPNIINLSKLSLVGSPCIPIRQQELMLLEVIHEARRNLEETHMFFQNRLNQITESNRQQEEQLAALAASNQRQILTLDSIEKKQKEMRESIDHLKKHHTPLSLEYKIIKIDPIENDCCFIAFIKTIWEYIKRFFAWLFCCSVNNFQRNGIRV